MNGVWAGTAHGRAAPVRAIALALAGALLGSVGCVSKRTYDEVETSLREAQARQREAEASNQQLLRKLKDVENVKEGDLARLRNLEDENVKLSQSIAKLRGDDMQKYAQLDERQRQVVIAFKQDLRERLKLEINQETNGLVLEHDAFFEATDAKLNESAVRLLGILAETLNQPAYADRIVYVDGHTDARPVSHNRELNPDNMVLGARRAALVVDALVRAGVDSKRLVVRSMGQSQPILKQDTKNPRNRRVEIVLGEHTNA